MTIVNNNSIAIQSGTLYLNDPLFDSKLFFTDDIKAYNFFVVREDIVLTYGVLNGYDNSINYSYRFDFNNYIKIDNQNIPELSLIDQFGSVKFGGKNTSNVSLLIGIGDILTQNITAENLIKETSGVIKLASGKTVNNLICNELFSYKFFDKVKGDNILVDTAMKNSFCPVTCYNNTITINFKDSNNINLIPQLYISKKTGDDYIVLLLKIHPKCEKVLINNVEYQTQKCNGGTDYFFWNYDGKFDRLSCTGNAKPTDNVNKSSIKVGNKVIFSKIDIVKQIKQNTGYELTDDKLFGLIQSPNINKLNDYQDVTNINLIPNITKYGSQSNLTVYGNNVVYLQAGQVYTFSALGVVSSTASGKHLTISLIPIGETTGQILTIESESQVLVSQTFIASRTGLYNIFSTNINGATSTTFYVKVELGSLSQSDYKSIVLPSIKQYTVDTTLFDSYIGKKYGEKNIELIFTDSKVQTRKTSFTTTFYD